MLTHRHPAVVVDGRRHEPPGKQPKRDDGVLYAERGQPGAPCASQPVDDALDARPGEEENGDQRGQNSDQRGNALAENLPRAVRQGDDLHLGCGTRSQVELREEAGHLDLGRQRTSFLRAARPDDRRAASADRERTVQPAGGVAGRSTMESRFPATVKRSFPSGRVITSAATRSGSRTVLSTTGGRSASGSAGAGRQGTLTPSLSGACATSTSGAYHAVWGSPAESVLGGQR